MTRSFNIQNSVLSLWANIYFLNALCTDILKYNISDCCCYLEILTNTCCLSENYILFLFCFPQFQVTLSCGYID